MFDFKVLEKTDFSIDIIWKFTGKLTPSSRRFISLAFFSLTFFILIGIFFYVKTEIFVNVFIKIAHTDRNCYVIGWKWYRDICLAICSIRNFVQRYMDLSKFAFDSRESQWRSTLSNNAHRGIGIRTHTFIYTCRVSFLIHTLVDNCIFVYWCITFPLKIGLIFIVDNSSSTFLHTMPHALCLNSWSHCM